MLDPAERSRCRYHLGYLNTQVAASITFGIPVPLQTMFLVEMAMDNVLDVALDRVRAFLTTLDRIECKMIEGQDYLVATRLDDLEIRQDHIDKLEDEYCRWAARLADTLGCPLYPGAAKFQRFFARVGGSSIPVRG